MKGGGSIPKVPVHEVTKGLLCPINNWIYTVCILFYLLLEFRVQVIKYACFNSPEPKGVEEGIKIFHINIQREIQELKNCRLQCCL